MLVVVLLSTPLASRQADATPSVAFLITAGVKYALHWRMAAEHSASLAAGLTILPSHACERERALTQIISGIISIAPQGHSATQMPQPLQ